MTGPFTDYLGHPHSPAADARILSLVPSLTELLYDLGLAHLLVGRTQFCIHPADRITTVPSVGGTKKIKMDRVAKLAPTHALLNVDENPKEMADALQAMGIQVVVTHPAHPDDNVALYQLIGGIFGETEQTARLIGDYKTARARLLDPATRPRRRALYLIWKDPWMAISPNTYIANMLTLVNWQTLSPGADPTIVGDSGRYPEVVIDDSTLDEVDLVLFSTEPYAFKNTDIKKFQKAYPRHAGKAHLIDGEMTSWYGSRAIHGLDYLGEFAGKVACS